MALTQVLTCKSREVKNTGYLRQLKRDEWVPAVVYGKGNDSLRQHLEDLFLDISQKNNRLAHTCTVSLG